MVCPKWVIGICPYLTNLILIRPNNLPQLTRKVGGKVGGSHLQMSFLTSEDVTPKVLTKRANDIRCSPQGKNLEKTTQRINHPIY